MNYVYFAKCIYRQVVKHFIVVKGISAFTLKLTHMSDGGAINCMPVLN